VGEVGRNVAGIQGDERVPLVLESETVSLCDIAEQSLNPLKMIFQRGEVQSPLGNRVAVVPETAIRCLVEPRVPQERADVDNVLDSALFE
jgi:hypothetical protein